MTLILRDGAGTTSKRGDVLIVGSGLTLSEDQDGHPLLSGSGLGSGDNGGSGSATGLTVSPGCVSVHFHADATSDLEVVNFPSTIQPLIEKYEYFRTNDYRRVRVVAQIHPSYVGSNGSTVYGAYSTDNWVTWNYLDHIGGPALQVSTAGTLRGEFVFIAAPALADVQLGVVGGLGNDSTVVAFPRLSLEFDGDAFIVDFPNSPGVGTTPVVPGELTEQDDLEIWLKADVGVTYNVGTTFVDNATPWVDQTPPENSPIHTKLADGVIRDGTLRNGQPGLKFTRQTGLLLNEGFESYTTPSLLAAYTPVQSGGGYTPVWSMDSTHVFAGSGAAKLTMNGIVGGGQYAILQGVIPSLLPNTNYSVAYKIYAINYANFPMNTWYQVPAANVMTDGSGTLTFGFGFLADSGFTTGAPLEWWFDGLEISAVGSSGFVWTADNNPRTTWTEAHMFCLVKKNPGFGLSVAGQNLFCKLGTDTVPSKYSASAVQMEYGTTTMISFASGTSGATFEQWHIFEVITAPGLYTVKRDGFQHGTWGTNTVAFPAEGSLGLRFGTEDAEFQLGEWLEYSSIQDDDKAERIRDYLLWRKQGLEAADSAPADTTDGIPVVTGLLAWHVGDRGIMTSTTGAVKAWADLSGHRNHLVYESESDATVRSSELLNSRNQLTFNDVVMAWPFDMLNNITINNVTQLEGFVVVKKLGAETGLWRLGADNTEYGAVDGKIYETFASAENQAGFTPTLDLSSAFRIYNVRASPAEWVAALNRTDQLRVAPHSVAGLGTAIFGSSAAGGFAPGNIAVAEVVLYSRVLTTSERDRVLKSINDRWALGVTVPISGGSGTVVSPLPIGTRPLGLFNYTSRYYGQYPPFNTSGQTCTPSTCLDYLNRMRDGGLKRGFIAPMLRKAVTNPDGTYNHAMAIALMRSYAAIDISEFITDGTITGTYVIDEPSCASCYGGVKIPWNVVDDLCRVAKEVWPYSPAFIRVDAIRCLQYQWEYLDGCWSQYPGPLRKWEGMETSDGKSIQAYIQQQRDAAVQQGLAAVWGFNSRNGGDGSSGVAGDIPGVWWRMTAAEIRRDAIPLAQETYSVGVFNWAGSNPPDPWLQRPDIVEALNEVAAILSAT